jgi:hypothetical protein
VLGTTDYLQMLIDDIDSGIPTTSTAITPDSLRAELPLWEAMREYLHYVPEARIADMEEFFGSEFGVNLNGANRQAIESALKRHPEAFKTHKKGREKYISLREKARD